MSLKPDAFAHKKAAVNGDKEINNARSNCAADKSENIKLKIDRKSLFLHKRKTSSVDMSEGMLYFDRNSRTAMHLNNHNVHLGGGNNRQ